MSITEAIATANDPVPAVASDGDEPMITIPLEVFATMCRAALCWREAVISAQQVMDLARVHGLTAVREVDDDEIEQGAEPHSAILDLTPEYIRALQIADAAINGEPEDEMDDGDVP